jgi:outer membrane lipoprotein-sorting protein
MSMMSHLAKVLELMHTSWQRWTTLRLEGHEWRHLQTFGRAWEHHVEELHESGAANVRSIALKRSDGREPAAESREDWRVWLAKPDKSRTEFQVGDDTVTAVFVGRYWWSWSPSRGFVTNNGAPNHGHGFGPAEALIDPARHLASLQLGDVAMASFRERQAFQVTAVPRTDDEHGFSRTFHILGTGADQYKLLVDAEVGVLLRVQADFRGHAFRVIEVDDVRVNGRFDDGTFDSNRLRNGLTAL